MRLRAAKGRLTFACLRRQCRDRQAASQNTAADFTDGINGPPHPRHNLGPPPSSTTTVSRSRGTPSLPMRAPYDRCPHLYICLF
ncbi:hypothetical protein [Streptomyces sp. NPDC101455]|uniref:hypothetical protein n=1 Tax=Streptomyces sp. NPDC101455 TaxID=3366142 RepID=UPI003809E891